MTTQLPETLSRLYEVQQDSIIQHWADVDDKLDELWKQRIIIFRAPTITQDDFYRSIGLMKDTLLLTRDMARMQDLPRLYDKVIQVLEEIITAIIQSPPGAQLSSNVIMQACEVGDILCSHVESSWDRERLLGVIGMYGNKTILDVLFAQYVPRNDSIDVKLYPHLMKVLEGIHGFYMQEHLSTMLQFSINSAALIPIREDGQARKAVETAVRLLFIGWMNGYRNFPGLTTSVQIEELIQETDAYRLLMSYPHIGVRIALIFIFNEMQSVDARTSFKPSTNYKVLQLLKVNLLQNDITGTTQRDATSLTSTACLSGILCNASWTLPWLWGQKEIDEEIVLAITIAWIMDFHTEINPGALELPVQHPVRTCITRYSDSLMKILTNMMQNTFYYDAYISEGKTIVEHSTLLQLNKLLWIVLLMLNSTTEITSSHHLVTTILNCFFLSVDQEWIDMSCWKIAVFIFSKVPQRVFAKAVQDSDAAGRLILIQQIMLREMESVMNKCSGYNGAPSMVQDIFVDLDVLINIAHFTTYIITSHEGLCSAFSKQSHFNSSLVSYIMRDNHESLIQSFQPELIWKHAASVGAITGLVVLIRKNSLRKNGNGHGFFKQGQGKSETTTLSIIDRLLRGDLESQYILASLCNLLGSLPHTDHSARHLILLKIMQEIRTLLLDNDTHKWCSMLPVLVQAVETALQHLDTLAKTHFIGNPWNGKLIHKCLLTIVEGKRACMNTDNEGRLPGDNHRYTGHFDCGIRIDGSLLKLALLLISENPHWKADVFANYPAPPISSFKHKDLPYTFKSHRLTPAVKVADLNRVIASYLEACKALDSGGRSGLQELINAELVVKLIELVPGTNDINKAWRTKIQRAKKQCRQPLILDADDDPFYRIHRPANGASCCLVPVLGVQEG